MTTTTQPPKGAAKAAAATGDFFDTRIGAAKLVKEFARKVFPDHWSFMLGEIALYSFIVLLLTGTFLTMFFVPSMTEVHYPEDALPTTMRGLEMSEAFASTLHLSFHVRGGLLMRQIHHWAALLFMAAIVTHMMRVFFTGAFRKPRELNWIVGFTLLILGLLAGFTGYSLPDDVLSGNGLRIADGVAKAIPILGSYVSFALFGGEFPGHDIIPRLFTAHILLVPGMILALVAVHLILVVVHKHTQYPGPGRTNSNVVGYPLFPVYMAKAGGFFFVVFGALAIMGATLSINNVWNYGPYDPSPVSAGAQPDWYMLFLEGSLRLMPGWEFVVLGYTVPMNILVPGVVIPGILFTALAAYPFIEAYASGDKREHHLLDRPRNVPTRTGVGVAILTAFIILAAAGSNDLIATHFGLSINAITWAFRVLFLAGPFIAFIITKRLCLALQRRDRDLVLHGHETGRVVRFASGEYIEVHQPLSDEERWVLVSFDPHKPLPEPTATNARGVARPGYKALRRRSKLSHFFFADRVDPVTPSELAAAQAHHAHGDHEVADHEVTEGESTKAELESSRS
ncbi:cytochrome bc1 complex cytochrome b subunit [Salana multivorans]